LAVSLSYTQKNYYFTTGNFYTDCTGMAAAVDTSGDGNLMIKLAYKEKIPVTTMRLNPSDKILF
jgi:hypothetical protein